MKFTVHNEIFADFPKAKFGFIYFTGIDNTKDLSNDFNKKRLELFKDVQSRGDELLSSEKVSAWENVFKNNWGLAGRDFMPSHKALIKRIINQGSIRSINPMVDIYNFVSIKNLVPIGGHSLANTNDDITIRKAKDDDIFIPMFSDSKEEFKLNIPAYTTGNKILTANLIWRQADASKVTPDTTDIFIPIDDLCGIFSKEDILSIAEEFINLVKSELGGTCSMGMVDSQNPSASLETSKKGVGAINKKTNTDPKIIDELLSRGVHALFTKEDLKKKLLSGKQLHLKLGTDVTSANLTLGHAVVHRKMRDFQELGHRVTLIIGDFTTLVGDHSDKVDMRGETNIEQIKEFEKTWTEQFFKTVLKENTVIRHNSEWLKGLDFNDVINLAKQFTVSQMLDRETFRLRYESEKPIGLDEFLYPLMQGYDSVALNCDIEFGGTDQTFNLLAGRKLMPAFGQVPQSALVMKLLTGNDGRPMGKSLKNYIPILDNANDMYGKIMSIIDEIIIEYFELITRVPMSEIKEMEKEMKAGKVNPMELKKKLAREVVSFYHSKEDAISAQNHFEQTVQNKEVMADDIESVKIKKSSYTLLELLKLVAKDLSGGEIKRLIIQGGISINTKVVKDMNQGVTVSGGEVIKIGKRRFVKLIIK